MSVCLFTKLIPTRGGLPAHRINHRIKLTQLLNFSSNLSPGHLFTLAFSLSSGCTSIRSLIRFTSNSNTVIGGATHFAEQWSCQRVEPILLLKLVAHSYYYYSSMMSTTILSLSLPSFIFACLRGLPTLTLSFSPIYQAAHLKS